MFSKQLKKVFKHTVSLVVDRRDEYITVEHVLRVILEDDMILDIIESLDGDIDEIKEQIEDYIDEFSIETTQKGKYDPVKTLALQRVIGEVIAHSESAEKNEAEIGDFLVAIYSEENSYARMILMKNGIEKLDVLEILSQQKHKKISKNEKKSKNKITPLEEFTINLTILAKDGKIDPLIGRELEVERLMQTLCRRKKNNPLLVGESGVGKTAIVEGLALNISEGKVPEVLANAQIYSLDIGMLIAGTKYRGEFENRIKVILKELKEKKDAVLFIDEIHTMVGAGATGGGSMDMSNLLKPALARGEIKCIGATTHTEWRNHFDKDKALSRRFAKIDVDEPSIDDSIEILIGLKSKYEEFHNIKYSNKIVTIAVNLAKKYINDKYLPDSAIDVIDEVGASFALKKQIRTNVTKHDIEQVISKFTNIPISSLSKDDLTLLRELGESLKKKVFGQNDAIDKLTTAIKRAKAGLGGEHRPIGVFLFVGPTGVGKTELAKVLAETLNIKFLRFDMSEYMEKHSVSSLIGSPPGYVGYEDGGELSEKIRKSPHSVLLLDEIEKAHPELINILLQVFDNAKLTDNQGREIDFRNVTIIMTSNLGAKEINQMGFGKKNAHKYNSAIKDFFSPEFINRLDAIVNFNPLERELMIKVVEKFLAQLELQLKDKDIKITATLKAKEHLAIEGFDQNLGARVLNRVIEKEITAILSDEILFGVLQNGGLVNIDFDGKKLNFEFLETQSK